MSIEYCHDGFRIGKRWYMWWEGFSRREEFGEAKAGNGSPRLLDHRRAKSREEENDRFHFRRRRNA